MQEDKTLFSRPATLDDLKLLIKSLNDNNANYVLIGGYALFAHGYQRATTDIDILVPATLESAEKIIKSLLILPDQAAKYILPEWFVDIENEDNGAIRVSDEITVDVMFNACGETYETLIKHQETIYIDDLPVNTIDLSGLLKTKQTLRHKDIADRIVLERAIHEINKKHLHLS